MFVVLFVRLVKRIYAGQRKQVEHSEKRAGRISTSHAKFDKANPTTILRPKGRSQGKKTDSEVLFSLRKRKTSNPNNPVEHKF
jgi:hypothetical protein